MRPIYLILMAFLPFLSFGQEKFEVIYKNDGYQQLIKHPKSQFKDSTIAVTYLNDLQHTAISKGFVLASVDTIVFGHNKAIVDFNLGKRMRAISLRIQEEDLLFLGKNSRINEKLISKIPFTPKELANTLGKIQETFLNNGYPFVSIQLKEHKFENNNLTADVAINRGHHYSWRNIYVKGDSSISSKYVSNLISIRVGDEFVESELGQISNRIEQIPFLREIKPAEILFTKEGAELYLYLETIPISSFNGIVGFQPDPSTKKLAITGELNLKLLNVLRRGELLDVRWQSIRDQTQSLNSRLNYPFLFNTPFGIDGTFDLYKRDTSFLELNSTIGVQYFLNRGSFIKAFYNNKSSSILSGGHNNPSFQNLGNTKSNSYGLSYSSKRVDYLPNPTKGLNFFFEGMMGTRKSQINDSSSIDKSIVYRGKLNIQYFIPLFKRHVILLGSSSAFYSAAEVYENEVYRFGGLNSQRGFNEDELFATTKSIATLEYRFLLDRNSNVFAFYDLTWYENNSNQYYNDMPYGFGVGFTFSTNFGVFSISYALGKQFENPILFSNSKVHFGYIVYF